MIQWIEGQHRRVACRTSPPDTLHLHHLALAVCFPRIWLEVHDNQIVQSYTLYLRLFFYINTVFAWFWALSNKAQICLSGRLVMRLLRLYGMVGTCVGGVVDDHMRVRQYMRVCYRSGVSAFVSYVIWCTWGGTYHQRWCIIQDGYKLSDMERIMNATKYIHILSPHIPVLHPIWICTRTLLCSCAVIIQAMLLICSLLLYSVFSPANSHVVVITRVMDEWRIIRCSFYSQLSTSNRWDTCV